MIRKCVEFNSNISSVMNISYSCGWCIWRMRLVLTFSLIFIVFNFIIIHISMQLPLATHILVSGAEWVELILNVKTTVRHIWHFVSLCFVRLMHPFNTYHNIIANSVIGLSVEDNEENILCQNANACRLSKSWLVSMKRWKERFSHCWKIIIFFSKV